MRALGTLLSTALVVILIGAGAAQEKKKVGARSLPLPAIGGWVMLPDGVTLVVGLPNGKLAYIDTVAVKEVKQVEAPVRPDHIAVRGGQLFVATAEGNVVHVLDRESGEAKKEIKLPDGLSKYGSAILVCHPAKGPVYAVLAKGNRIAAIDPESGAVTVQEPLGKEPLRLLKKDGTPEKPPQYWSAFLWNLAMDPNQSDALYAVYRANDRQGNFGVLAKYIRKGKALELVGFYQGAASGDSGLLGPVVRVSGDGKKVGVANSRELAVFSAADVRTLAGRVKCCTPGFHGQVGRAGELAFHPVLDLGAVEETNAANSPQGVPAMAQLHLFSSKSLGDLATFDVPNGSDQTPSRKLLTFGGRGTTLIYLDSKELRFIPLTLSDKDKEALAKAYGGEPK